MLHPPIASGRIVSPYGPRTRPRVQFHRGVDVGAPAGTAVFAVADGVIEHAVSGPRAGFAGYGKVVVQSIDEAPPHRALYAHLSEVLVQRGQRVRAGELIARSGDTAFSPSYPDARTAAHLHFEVVDRALPLPPGIGRIDPQTFMGPVALVLQPGATPVVLGGEAEDLAEQEEEAPEAYQQDGKVPWGFLLLLGVPTLLLIWANWPRGARRPRRHALGAVGQEWQSPKGRRWIVHVENGRAFIRTEGMAYADILPEAEVPKEIQRDAANLIFWQRQREIAAREQAEEAAALAAKRFLHGFTTGMPAVQARRVEAALDKTQGFSGRFMRRREFIEAAVAAGARVGQRQTGRALTMPDGGFYTEKDITKTAVDYAEFLGRGHVLGAPPTDPPGPYVSRKDRTAAAARELRAAGARLERREDAYGVTRSGWWQDDVYLAETALAALRILRGGG